MAEAAGPPSDAPGDRRVDSNESRAQVVASINKIIYETLISRAAFFGMAGLVVVAASQQEAAW